MNQRGSRTPSTETDQRPSSRRSRTSRPPTSNGAGGLAGSGLGKVALGRPGGRLTGVETAVARKPDGAGRSSGAGVAGVDATRGDGRGRLEAPPGFEPGN